MRHKRRGGGLFRNSVSQRHRVAFVKSAPTFVRALEGSNRDSRWWIDGSALRRLLPGAFAVWRNLDLDSHRESDTYRFVDRTPRRLRADILD